MSAGLLDFYIEQGATYRHQLIWQDSAEALIDLTNYTARLQIRSDVKSAAALIDLTTENGGLTLGGVTGTIDIAITSAVTAAIDWINGVYDLEMISGSGDVIRLVEGCVQVSFEVTR